MRDQAAQLRNLVLRAARETRTHAGTLPNVQWLIGAEPRVGTTALSVGLAELLADNGYQVVLINGQGDQERFARLTSTQNVDSDWLGQRQEIHEVMQVVQAGLQVVGSLGDLGTDQDSVNRCHWLRRQLCTLRAHADLVMIETSQVGSVLASHLSDWAANATVVTTTSDSSVMNCYAAIKSIAQPNPKCKISVLVNRAQTANQAQEIGNRLVHSCQRFLSTTPAYAGGVVEDEAFGASIETGKKMEGLPDGPTLASLRNIGIRMVGEQGRNQSAA